RMSRSRGAGTRHPTFTRSVPIVKATAVGAMSVIARAVIAARVARAIAAVGHVGRAIRRPVIVAIDHRAVVVGINHARGDVNRVASGRDVVIIRIAAVIIVGTLDDHRPVIMTVVVAEAEAETARVRGGGKARQGGDADQTEDEVPYSHCFSPVYLSLKPLVPLTFPFRQV